MGKIRAVIAALMVTTILLSMVGVETFMVVPVSASSGQLLYSIVHFSDTQTLVQSYVSTLNYTFQWLESKKSEWNITAIIITGDLVETYNNVTQWNNYVNAKTLTSIPVYEVAGNHDTDTGTDFTYYNQYIGENETFYVADITEHFLLIGISWNGSDNTISQSYVETLKSTIENNPSKYYIIATHWYMGQHNGDPTVLSTLGSTLYNESYLNYPNNVVMVLCGHIVSGGTGVMTSNTRDGLHEYMTNIQGANQSYVRVFKVYSNNTVAVELWRLVPSPEELVETESFTLPTLETVGWLTGWNYRKSHEIIGSTSGSVADYQVRITVHYGSGTDSGEHVYLDGKCKTDFGDIRFTAGDGVTELSYWIKEKVDGDYAVFWVKVPSIPASPDLTTIYIYYNNTEATTTSNATDTFIYYEDFDSLAAGSDPPGWTEYTGAWQVDSEGHYEQTLSDSGWNVDHVVTPVSGSNLAIHLVVHIGSQEYHVPKFYIFARATGVDSNLEDSVNGYAFILDKANQELAIRRYDAGRWTALTTQGFSISANTDYEVEFRLYGSTLIGVADSTTISATDDNYTDGSVVIAIHDLVGWIDDFYVRNFIDPEPTHGEWGAEEKAVRVTLPAESLYLIHNIVYSPNSTQFTHTFVATNTTTAGYETSYFSAYGWRVYANPYLDNATSYENSASLVSEVNITLPYSAVLVENVTFMAKTNGTGNCRRLWVKVLDSSGGVVAELSNATIGTDWTSVTLTVGSSLSGQLTIWLNATVNSTTSAGEEIVIKDVKAYVNYSTNPLFKFDLAYNVQYFNCTASHDVMLGSSEYLNSSVIDLKFIEYLIYDSVDYPTQPVQVGNETINSYNYTVYRIDPATYAQSLTIYALIRNRISTFRTHVKGFDTETVLIGEVVSLELPDVANVTIAELGLDLKNVQIATIRFNSTGTFTIICNQTILNAWKLGLGKKTITVKYGIFTVKPLDTDSKVIDYDNLQVQLVNKTSGEIVKEVTGKTLITLDNLWTGNYTVVAKIKDIVIGVKDFVLNITTDGTTLDLRCVTKNIEGDYRGLNKTIVCEYDKQIVNVESLSSKFPFSRTRILLNGSGAFKLYVGYVSDLPTFIKVEGNVTNLLYYWNDTYLTIQGNLASAGELNVTDLYKVTIESYDRLGNLMQEWMYVYINGTKYSGAVVEDYLYPENYVVELPDTVNGFKFYTFWDGYNETARTVTVNHTDIELEAWYRVPTSASLSVKTHSGLLAWVRVMLNLEASEVSVYVDGELTDYYGNGVPDKPVVVNITNLETEYTLQLNTTTDISGYFKTDYVTLARDKDYEIKVIYEGDDIYVGTSEIKQVEIEALPSPVEVIGVPTEYIMAVIIAIVVVIAVALFMWRAAKHAIENEFIRRRRFVRRKT